MSLLTVLPTMTQEQTSASAEDAKGTCPIAKLEVERLPDLTIPRAGHQLFCVGGEYVVAGGHTNGFVPTPTAEYFKDGQWHVMQMVYTHDNGMSVILDQGRKVLLAGGSSEAAGIGQTFMAEMYDPAAHSFDGFAILSRKRTLASGLELDSGRVVVAGNWYHDDGIEMFDGTNQFMPVKEVSTQRSIPYIFRIGSDDALIFGNLGTRVGTTCSTIADQLKGAPVSIPLFEAWRPLVVSPRRSAESFIGDELEGIYTYLFAVEDSTGQVAIAQIVNGDASLFPTDCPVPMTCQGDSIWYYSSVIADRQHRRAYLMGVSNDDIKHSEKGIQHYALCIDFSQATPGHPARLTLYHTNLLQTIPDYSPILTDDGNLLIAGGLSMARSNFYPSNDVYLLPLGRQSTSLSKPVGSRSFAWWWLLAAGAIVAGAVGILLMRKQKSPHSGDRQMPAEVPAAVPSDVAAQELMSRINDLMERRQLYLNSDLKVSDIAEAFNVHRNDISACINSQKGCTFAQYINHYRIDYAQQLMRHEPDKKISSVWLESGFGTEQTFFKIFRAATGLSPKEWISREID